MHHLQTRGVGDTEVAAPAAGDILVGNAGGYWSPLSGGLPVSSISGVLTVGQGGIGVATLAIHGVLIGNAANPVTVLAAAASGTLLGGVTGADPAFTDSPAVTGTVTAKSGTAATGGGALAVTLGSTAAMGIYWGSGPPTIVAAQGSLYLRTEGGATTRAYIATDGSGTWTALVSVG